MNLNTILASVCIVLAVFDIIIHLILIFKENGER